MLNQSADLDRLFQALADPARRAMVERLARGPAPVSELARPLPMSLPSAMQHLSVLEAAGLVRSEKVGRVRTCAIAPGAPTGGCVPAHAGSKMKAAQLNTNALKFETFIPLFPAP